MNIIQKFLSVVFFISIFISHQNFSKLDFICNDEYLVEAETVNSINFQILNSSKEKKINIDIEYNKKNVGNYNFNDRINFFKMANKKKLFLIFFNILNIISSVFFDMFYFFICNLPNYFTGAS